MVDLEERVKLRVLGDRVEQLTGVIVPTCLNQLQQHGRNIQQYQEEEEWESLKREKRNVSKTIRQLRTHIQELDDVKGQVTEEDHSDLELAIKPTQERIIESILAFKHLDPSVVMIDDTVQEQDYVALCKGGTAEVTSEVWTELNRELEELQELSTALLEHVKDQHEIVDRLEVQVNEAEDYVHGSMITIQKMARIKAMMLPVGGALVGGIVGGVMGGPVGLLAGVKVGTVVAVAGGTAGAVGGGIIGYKRGQNIKGMVDDLTPKKEQ